MTEHELDKNPILGKSQVVSSKMVEFVKQKNPNAENIDEIAKCFIEVGNKYGIRGDIAFCQSIIETGWFTFKDSAVTPDQYNYCGLGVISKGVKGNSFKTVEEGVTAQIQHLYGYTVTTPLDNSIVIDPRYKYLVSGNKLGIAQNWEALNMKWSMSSDYSSKILSIYKQLKEFTYENEETGDIKTIILEKIKEIEELLNKLN